MVGFAQGLSPAMTAAFASVAADYNALQLGPCPELPDTLRARIAKEAAALAERAVELEE